MDNKKLFQPNLGNLIICSTMGYNSHAFISERLTFDDPTTLSACFETERLATYREVFELINKNFAQGMLSDPCVAIN